MILLDAFSKAPKGIARKGKAAKRGIGSNEFAADSLAHASGAAFCSGAHSMFDVHSFIHSFIQPFFSLQPCCGLVRFLLSGGQLSEPLSMICKTFKVGDWTVLPTQ